jgi:Tat protein translocase TatB subunit
MIDFGFDKIALIGAVALIVIGPEKLPKVARTVGHLMGKAQRYVADVKAEVNRSIELEELQEDEDAVRGRGATSRGQGTVSSVRPARPSTNRRLARSRAPADADSAGMREWPTVARVQAPRRRSGASSAAHAAVVQAARGRALACAVRRRARGALPPAGPEDG